MKALKTFPTLALAGLLACGMNAAQAQSNLISPTIRPVIGIGFTAGGDKLADADYTDGSTDSIRAGGLIQVHGGLEFRVAPTVAIQATLGYHLDTTRAARNGGIEFSRWPVEALVLVDVAERFRLGAGVRHVSSSRVHERGDAGSGSYAVGSATGFVLEGEYRVLPSLGVKLRGVKETYKLSGKADVDGSHVGAFVNFYF